MSPNNLERPHWFAEEVQPHEPALRAWLRSKYPSLPDVDDIVQESYLRLFRARESGRIDSTKAYLFGIARHVALGVFKKERARSAVAVNDFVGSDTENTNGDVFETISLKQEFTVVTEAIKTLPERCRQVVTPRGLHGLSYREIAVRLGLAEDTVRVQMARGVKKCAQFLRERGMNERHGDESF